MSDRVVIQSETQIDSGPKPLKRTRERALTDVKTGLLLDFQGVSRLIRGRALSMLST